LSGTLLAGKARKMHQVPFHRPCLGIDEEREVLEVLRSGWITTGPKAKRFEQEFAAYVGARRAVAVAHCTGALHLALWALGVGAGDEVITTPFTFTATAEAIAYLGARPVFVDIEPESLNLDPAKVEQLLQSGRLKRPRVLLPVHFAGQACDMNRLLPTAECYKLKVVEDAAHAAGSAIRLGHRGMVKVGTIGNLTCFSFYATKNITTAEGGMVTTDDDVLADRIVVASLHGMNRDAWKRYDATGSWYYEIDDLGFKYNLSDVHAAIGLAQLKRVDEFQRRRAQIACTYNEAFGAQAALQTPTARADVAHAWHLYVLRLRGERLRIGRDAFVELLRRRGVGVSVHCIPLHLMRVYQVKYGYRPGDFPLAEDAYSRCLSLPIYPAMSERDVNYVIDTVLATVRDNLR
jgi:dTDP-4-amino-4,6-dideoxygalactose transaminase